MYNNNQCETSVATI